MFKAECRRIFSIRHIQLIFCFFVMLNIGQIIGICLANDQQYSEYQNALRTEYYDRFDEILQEKKTQLESQQDSVLFQSENNQSEIKEELAVVNTLSSQKLYAVHDRSFLLVVKILPYWSLFYVLCGLAFVYDLFCQDEENHLVSFYDTTITDRRSRILSKITILAYLYLFLFICKISIDHLIFTVCGLHKDIPVQNVYGYMHTNIIWNITQYDLVLNLYVILCSFLTVLLFCLFFWGTKNIGISMTITSVFLLIEFMIYCYVSITSSYAIFKMANLFFGLMVQKLPAGFISLYGFTCNTPFFIVCLFLIIMIALTGLLIIVYQIDRKGITNPSKKKHVLRIRSLILFQMKDLWITHKGLLCMLVIFGYCFSSAMSYTVTKTADDVLFEQYRSQFYGDINQDLLDRIELEDKNMQLALEQREAIITQWQGKQMPEEVQDRLSKLSEITVHASYLNKVKEEIRELYEAKGETYQNTDGVKYLVMKDNLSGNLLNFMLIIIPVIVLACVCVTKQYSSSFHFLTDCTLEGRRKILGNTYLLFMGYALLLFCIVFGLHFYAIYKNYPISLQGQVNTLLGISSSMEMMPYLVLSVCNSIILISSFVLMTMCLSEKYGVSAMYIILSVLFLSFPVTGIFIHYDYLNHPLLYGLILFILFTFHFYVWLKKRSRLAS